MLSYVEQIESILHRLDTAELKVETLGHFKVWRNGKAVQSKSWGRDKTLQLLQYLITTRQRRGMHKEQIIDRLWEESDGEAGDRDFKVAMHGINKALEPERKSREAPKFVVRQGLTYQLNFEAIALDVDILEDLVATGNEAIQADILTAQKAYSAAIKLYKGPYLPNRLYEDWTSVERERIQVLVLGTLINLAELIVDSNPLESIRLCQKAIGIDPSWEDAYRIQMKAYINRGNRPQALKVYGECEKVLDREYGIEPLPQTRALLREIEMIGQAN